MFDIMFTTGVAIYLSV